MVQTIETHTLTAALQKLAASFPLTFTSNTLDVMKRWIFFSALWKKNFKIQAILILTILKKFSANTEQWLMRKTGNNWAVGNFMQEPGKSKNTISLCKGICCPIFQKSYKNVQNTIFFKNIYVQKLFSLLKIVLSKFWRCADAYSTKHPKEFDLCLVQGRKLFSSISHICST